MKKLIFISYARSDGREYAERLERDLQAAGFATWRDTRDLDRDADFSLELAEAIRSADWLAVVVTPLVETSFVMKEIGYAQQPSVNKPIIPCLFPNATIPILLVNVTTVPFSAGIYPKQTLGYEGGLARLTARLRGEPEPPSPGADGPFRDYAQALYDSADDYLKRYVVELMPGHEDALSLVARTTPGAVEAPIQRQMLRSFFTMHNPAAAPAPAQEKYERFDEAFAAFKGRVLLLGDPGAGKTTTLMVFARDAAARRLNNADEPLPILARISSWDAAKKTSLHEWLAEQSDGALTAEQIAALIAQKRTLLLLDGLDELGGKRDLTPGEALTPGPSPSGRGAKDEMRDDDDPVGASRRLAPTDSPLQKIDPRREFMQKIPTEGQVVVSCRIKDYAEIGEKARLNGAVTLQPLGPAQIEAYLSGQPDLWAAIRDDEDLLSVASTPLLLSYFAYAFRDLPEETKALRSLSKGEVRTMIFDTYVQRRYDYEKRTRPHNVPIPREEMERILGEVAFANMTDGSQRDNMLERKSFRRATRGVEEAETIIAQARVLHLLAANDLRFVHLLLRDYFAFPVAIDALTNEFHYIRENAAHALGKLGDVRAVALLVSALADNNRSVRIGAVRALEKIGSDLAVEPLIATLRDEDWEVRRDAASALGKIGDVRAVESLIHSLASGEEDARHAQEAANDFDGVFYYGNRPADALRSFGPAAVDPLIHALKDADWHIRRGAANVLEIIGGARSMEPLIHALSDANWEVRECAQSALIGLCDSDNSAVGSLIQVLELEDADVCRRAILILGHIRNPHALQPLTDALQNANVSIRRRVVEILGNFGGAPMVIDSLASALKDIDVFVRTMAVFALGKINNEAAIDLLRTTLGDSDALVRRSVVEVLGKFGGSTVVEPLISTLSDEDWRVRRIAANALERIGTPEALAALEEYRRRGQP